ncbi:MAG: hypothetical protein Q7S74_04015 [Nanoarchaeota archaeon]|nr:hypothetical protein [Nanoarchaeota archaeon]
MAKGKSAGSLIGSWAFLIGVILAVVFGFLGSLNQTLIYILVIIGIIVGLLNIADKEVGPFLMSGAVLIIAGALGQSVTDGVPILSNILQALLVLFVPATIIVAIKNVFSLARD